MSLNNNIIYRECMQQYSHGYNYSINKQCIQDELLAELEEFELETDLLEVGEPSKALDLGDPIDELPEVRKYPVIYIILMTLWLLCC